MTTYQDSRFHGESIDLDGGVFRDCVFEDCALRFSAQGPTELSGCTFARSRLVAAGAAELTLTYLRGFYSGLGDWGRTTVEQLFAEIRGEARPEAASDRAALEAFGETAEGRAIVRGFQKLSPDHRKRIAELIDRAAHQDA